MNQSTSTKNDGESQIQGIIVNYSIILVLIIDYFSGYWNDIGGFS